MDRMCGRFTLSTRPDAVANLCKLPEVPELFPRYNVAPSQPIAAVRVADGTRVLRPMTWGLVPHWAKGPKPRAFINARSETVATSPAFRAPFRRRRCLIPADGFFEWANAGTKKKQPYHFRLKSAEPF